MWLICGGGKPTLIKTGKIAVLSEKVAMVVVLFSIGKVGSGMIHIINCASSEV